MNRFLNPGGNSFLPISVGGFIQANILNCSCLSMAVISPLSVRYNPPPSNSPDKLSKVSVDAKLISSNNTQSPFRTAFTNAPSINENAKLFEIFLRCSMNFLMERLNKFHLDLKFGLIIVLLTAVEEGAGSVEALIISLYKFSTFFVILNNNLMNLSHC